MCDTFQKYFISLKLFPVMFRDAYNSSWKWDIFSAFLRTNKFPSQETKNKAKKKMSLFYHHHDNFVELQG